MRLPRLLLGLAVVFFVWNPYDYSWGVTGSILLGLAVTVALQEWFCFKSPTWTRQRTLERGEDPDTARQFADAPTV